VRPARLTKAADKHFVPRLEIQYKKMEGRFPQLNDHLYQIAQCFTRPDIDNDSRASDFAAGGAETFGEFRNQRDREIINTEESQILESFKNGPFPGTAHPCYDYKILKTHDDLRFAIYDLRLTIDD
jgi:hypothetical protein